MTPDKKFVKSSHDFFIPVKVLGKKFRGKFLHHLNLLYEKKKLDVADNKYQNSYQWSEFRDQLYKKVWIPFIKETFNGFGNAIEYLGRYTHRIAISNSRITKVTDTEVSFTATDYKTGMKKEVTLSHVKFIKRFLMHVLPFGFQKIRYYGFLNNRSKRNNLKLIEKLTGKALFKARYSSMSMKELMKELWNIDIEQCPVCKNSSMRHSGRTFAMLN